MPTVRFPVRYWESIWRNIFLQSSLFYIFFIKFIKKVRTLWYTSDQIWGYLFLQGGNTLAISDKWVKKEIKSKSGCGKRIAACSSMIASLIFWFQYSNFNLHFYCDYCSQGCVCSISDSPSVQTEKFCFHRRQQSGAAVSKFSQTAAEYCCVKNNQANAHSSSR